MFVIKCSECFPFPSHPAVTSRSLPLPELSIVYSQM